jgi:hypothetical protein
MNVREERPLSSEEVVLLEWLIDHGRPDASKYRFKIPLLRVVSRCGCGCPTIDSAMGDTSHKTGGSHIIADGQATTPEGAFVGVILHVREGEISELEVYSITGEESRFSLPKPETITLWPE